MHPTSDQPVVIATFDDAGATLEIDGVPSEITGGSQEDARREVLRRTVDVAASAQRDVLLVTTDSDGRWEVTVSPEGDISEHAQDSDSAPETGEIDTAVRFLPFVTDTVPPMPAPAVPPTEREDDGGDDDRFGRDSEQDPDAAVPHRSTFTEVISAPPIAAPVPSPVTAPSPVAAPTASSTASPTSSVSLVPEPEPTVPSAPASLATPAAPAAPAAGSSADAGTIPTLADFQASQPAPVAGPAQQGWQSTVRRLSFGSIAPRPGAKEMQHRHAISAVTRSLDGPRTICVINPKGGAHKTTAAMLIASTFGVHRGGYTLAWDNNETRGTLGWRAQRASHTNTAVNLLRDLDRFSDPVAGRVGDLDNYVRSQADAQFDVLASDEDAAASSMIDAEAFSRLHQTLQRFYRIIVVDTGNNMRASNWEAAVDAADQLVIVSAMREDTAGGAAWMVEGLAQKGHEDKLRSAVTVLSSPEKTVDAHLRSRLHDHFGGLTRAVVEVPHDASLVSGGPIVIDALAPATREAWLHATATIADSL
ncbi:MinD/ParA family protein [Marisediminicola sp. LYQ134]|uniref:MinD/ParA family ATP-binding protein n=1 Tax=Marisediminicola sp. LYQ134 TaxID=3391061 RepID=UPI0039838486